MCLIISPDLIWHIIDAPMCLKRKQSSSSKRICGAKSQFRCLAPNQILKDSQSAAQQIGNILRNAGVFSKGGKGKKNIRPWLDRPFNTQFKKPPVDASQTGGVGGYAPMVLGQA